MGHYHYTRHTRQRKKELEQPNVMRVDIVKVVMCPYALAHPQQRHIPLYIPHVRR